MTLAMSGWLLLAVMASAQSRRPEPVFGVGLACDLEPAVAGETLTTVVTISIDRGWHVNSDRPGDEFSLPTTLVWTLPAGWPEPVVRFPDGEPLSFAFSDAPIEVWQGVVTIVGELTVPRSAFGAVELAVEVTAQACNDTQCLPPVPVTASRSLEVVAAAGAVGQQPSSGPPRVASGDGAASSGGSGAEASRLAGLSLPMLVITVFLAGLALNLTPCVYPLIPITVGFFAAQSKERPRGTFPLALLYVAGMSATYSILGVTAALTGRLFGTALQSPIVIAVIVAVLVLLAASMFGLWELRVPGWAMRASGGRSGYLGALLMGLIVGFVAAPCIGPFVLGLLTYVGQRGDPLLGFGLFFALSLGLGLPYLVLGTFTGAINRLPASGAWMIGVRRVFGVLLIALAVYFARPLLPSPIGAAAMAAVLVVGGLYLLVVERTGHEQPAVDRFMRLVSVALVIAGVLYVPRAEVAVGGQQEWPPYEAERVEAAIASGRPVIIDFYADWCAPCHELEDKTFADPRVVHVLSAFDRFKVDQTRSTAEGDAAAARFEVLGMPTVIAFRNGRELFRLTGFEPPDRFLERFR